MSRRNGTAAATAAQAKGIGRSSRNADNCRTPRRENLTPLSPTLADEIREALATLQGTRKVEFAAADLGWSRDTWYERLRHPENMTVGELLALIARAADPTFGPRVRAHVSALEQYRAAFEREAGDFYVRVTRRDPRQSSLPFGGDR